MITVAFSSKGDVAAHKSLADLITRLGLEWSLTRNIEGGAFFVTYLWSNSQTKSVRRVSFIVEADGSWCEYATGGSASLAITEKWLRAVEKVTP